MGVSFKPLMKRTFQNNPDLRSFLLSLFTHLLILLALGLAIDIPEPIVTLEATSVDVISSVDEAVVKKIKTSVVKRTSSSQNAAVPKSAEPASPARQGTQQGLPAIDTAPQNPYLEESEEMISRTETESKKKDKERVSQPVKQREISLKEKKADVFNQGKIHDSVNSKDSKDNKDRREKTKKAFQWKDSTGRKIVSEATFILPPELKNRPIHEVVVVSFKVDRQGVVFSPQLLRSGAYPALERAVLEFLRKLRFNQAEVISEGTLTYSFKS